MTIAQKTLINYPWNRFSVAKVWPSGDFSLMQKVAPSTMGLSHASNSHKVISKRGEHGITRYGVKMVKSAAALLESRYRRENLSFLTATVPNLSELERNRLAKSWGEVTRQFQQEIKRELGRKYIPQEIVYVTEINQRRFEANQEVYVHLHCVFVGRKNSRSPWAISVQRISQIWNSILSTVLCRKIEAKAGTQIQKVKKSVVGYLSKYLSKGSQIVNQVITAGLQNYLPNSWYGMTTAIRSIVQAHRLTLDGSAVSNFVRILLVANSSSKARVWDVTIPGRIDEPPYLVGVAGILFQKPLQEVYHDSFCPS